MVGDPKAPLAIASSVLARAGSQRLHTKLFSDKNEEGGQVPHIRKDSAKFSPA